MLAPFFLFSHHMSSHMSDATGRAKHVLPSHATASKETTAAAAAPERSKGQPKPKPTSKAKPQGDVVQPLCQQSKASSKAPICKTIIAPILENPDSESEENNDSSGSNDSSGLKLSKAEKKAFNRLLAIKKQADVNQCSQAMTGKILISF